MHPPPTRSLRRWALLALAACSAFLLLSPWPRTLLAAPPAWWPKTLTPSPAPADSHAATHGQAMFMAAEAQKKLNVSLATIGGAGPEIDQLMLDYQAPPGPSVKNSRALRIGQLKYVSSLFWKRLQQAGVPGVPPAPEWPYRRMDQPIWTPGTMDDQDDALAALGQVKTAFSFDIPATGPQQYLGLAHLWKVTDPLYDGMLAGTQLLPVDSSLLRPAFRTGSGLKLHNYGYTLQNGTARTRVVVSRGTLDAPTLLHYSSLPDRTALFAAGTPTTWSFYPGEGFGPKGIFASGELNALVSSGTLAADSELHFGTLNKATFKSGHPTAFVHYQAFTTITNPDARYRRPNAGGYVVSGTLAANTLLPFSPFQKVPARGSEEVVFENFWSGNAGTGTAAQGYVRKLTLQENFSLPYGLGTSRQVNLRGGTRVVLAGSGSSVYVETGVSHGPQNLAINSTAFAQVPGGSRLRFSGGYLVSHRMDPDQDDDLLPDTWETQHQLNPLSDAGTQGTHGDPDQDGLTNLEEFIHGTHPNQADTDADSIPDATEVNQGSNPADGTDQGKPVPPEELVEVPFRVGDDSASKSERWSMTIRGTDPLRDKRKFKLANDEFGTVTNPPYNIKLRRGAAYEITLDHLDTDHEGDTPDYDWMATVGGLPTGTTSAQESQMFAIANHWIVDNRQGVLGRLPDADGNEKESKAQGKKAFLLPVEIGVDNNRDGTLSIGSAEDLTTVQKAYRFWLNNDDDTGWEPEDTYVANRDNPWTPSVLDNLDSKIKETRDLEDFSRIHIRASGIRSMLADGLITMGLKWKTKQSGFPALRLFRAVEAEGGTKYLSSPVKAREQVATATSGVGVVEGTTILELPASLWTPVDAQPIQYFLFEGVGEGKGELTIIFKQEGRAFGETGSTFLELLDIRKMYEQWGINPAAVIPDPDVDVPGTISGVTAVKYNTPFNGFPLYEFQAAWDESLEDKEYVICVHGWRKGGMAAATLPQRYKGRSDEITIFKRLWHRGFKGRYIGFIWPTYDVEVGTQTGADALSSALQSKFNHSEYRAWKCGEAFKDFISGLPQEYSKKVIAHSLGNVVVGSALEKGMLIQNYALLNAAIPTRCYHQSAPTPISTLALLVPPPNGPKYDMSDNPTALVRFLSYRGEIVTATRSRLEGAGGKISNFYLPKDSALVGLGGLAN